MFGKRAVVYVVVGIALGTIVGLSLLPRNYSGRVVEAEAQRRTSLNIQGRTVDQQIEFEAAGDEFFLLLSEGDLISAEYTDTPLVPGGSYFTAVRVVRPGKWYLSEGRNVSLRLTSQSEIDLTVSSSLERILVRVFYVAVMYAVGVLFCELILAD